MGIYFRIKAYRILGDIKGVKTYTNDIMVHRKYIFLDNIKLGGTLQDFEIFSIS